MQTKRYNNITIACPAKINLTLKVGKVRPDGFHPIESVMQSISLFDYLTIETIDDGIVLLGNSTEIPYDEKNIVYKAAKLFYETTDIKQGVRCHIQKNIPVCAGLAGGSTNAAGMVYGLNLLNNSPLSQKEMLSLCEKLGSDLNFCLLGGSQMAKGRGEILEELPFKEYDVTLVKPKHLGISAKEAYLRFDELKDISNMPNDLEFALLPYYKELQKLHDLGLQMSGSGPTYFIKTSKLPFILSGEYEVYEGLKTINHGILEVLE